MVITKITYTYIVSFPLWSSYAAHAYAPHKALYLTFLVKDEEIAHYNILPLITESKRETWSLHNMSIINILHLLQKAKLRCNSCVLPRELV